MPYLFHFVVVGQVSRSMFLESRIHPQNQVPPAGGGTEGYAAILFKRSERRTQLILRARVINGLFAGCMVHLVCSLVSTSVFLFFTYSTPRLGRSRQKDRKGSRTFPAPTSYSPPLALPHPPNRHQLNRWHHQVAALFNVPYGT